MSEETPPEVPIPTPAPEPPKKSRMENLYPTQNEKDV